MKPEAAAVQLNEVLPQSAGGGNQPPEGPKSHLRLIQGGLADGEKYAELTLADIEFVEKDQVVPIAPHEILSEIHEVTDVDITERRSEVWPPVLGEIPDELKLAEDAPDALPDVENMDEVALTDVCNSLFSRLHNYKWAAKGNVAMLNEVNSVDRKLAHVRKNLKDHASLMSRDLAFLREVMTFLRQESIPSLRRKFFKAGEDTAVSVEDINHQLHIASFPNELPSVDRSKIDSAVETVNAEVNSARFGTETQQKLGVENEALRNQSLHDLEVLVQQIHVEMAGNGKSDPDQKVEYERIASLLGSADGVAELSMADIRMTIDDARKVLFAMRRQSEFTAKKNAMREARRQDAALPITFENLALEMGIPLKSDGSPKGRYNAVKMKYFLKKNPVLKVRYDRMLDQYKRMQEAESDVAIFDTPEKITVEDSFEQLAVAYNLTLDAQGKAGSIRDKWRLRKLRKKDAVFAARYEVLTAERTPQAVVTQEAAPTNPLANMSFDELGKQFAINFGVNAEGETVRDRWRLSKLLKRDAAFAARYNELVAALASPDQAVQEKAVSQEALDARNAILRAEGEKRGEVIAVQIAAQRDDAPAPPRKSRLRGLVSTLTPSRLLPAVTAAALAFVPSALKRESNPDADPNRQRAAAARVVKKELRKQTPLAAKAERVPAAAGASSPEPGNGEGGFDLGISADELTFDAVDVTEGVAEVEPVDPTKNFTVPVRGTVSETLFAYYKKQLGLSRSEARNRMRADVKKLRRTGQEPDKSWSDPDWKQSYVRMDAGVPTLEHVVTVAGKKKAENGTTTAQKEDPTRAFMAAVDASVAKKKADRKAGLEEFMRNVDESTGHKKASSPLSQKKG